MTSVTEICNHALLINGQAPIANITEKSTEAIYCRQFYDPTRREILRAFPWNFALKTAVMNGVVETSDKWEYVYQLPVDCLRVLEIHPEDGAATGDSKIEFEVIGNKLYANEENAWCKYIYDCEDTSLFSDMFASVVFHRLAAYISMPIHRDANYTQMLYQMFQKVFAEARTADSNEGQFVPTFGRTFLNARK